MWSEVSELISHVYDRVELEVHVIHMCCCLHDYASF